MRPDQEGESMQQQVDERTLDDLVAEDADASEWFTSYMEERRRNRDLVRVVSDTLEFYARRSNYVSSSLDGGEVICPITEDRGERARDLLRGEGWARRKRL